MRQGHALHPQGTRGTDHPPAPAASTPAQASQPLPACTYVAASGTAPEPQTRALTLVPGAPAVKPSGRCHVPSPHLSFLSCQVGDTSTAHITKATWDRTWLHDPQSPAEEENAVLAQNY